MEYLPKDDIRKATRNNFRLTTVIIIYFKGTFKGTFDLFINAFTFQPAFTYSKLKVHVQITCSKLTIETLEQDVKYV